MDISLPDLTMKSLDDSDYESRENTICEDVKVRGVCFRELGIQFHSTSLVMGMFFLLYAFLIEGREIRAKT